MININSQFLLKTIKSENASGNIVGNDKFIKAGNTQLNLTGNGDRIINELWQYDG